MHVFITGGTGLIGSAVVAELLDHGHTVLLGARDQTRGEEAAAKLRADGLNVAVFKQTRDGADWVDSPTAGQTETVDTDQPSAARMYDYFLGGGHNFAVVSNPKVHVHIDDARHFLQTTKETFDAITSGRRVA